MSSPMMNKMLGLFCCCCRAAEGLTTRGIDARRKMPTNHETFFKLTFIRSPFWMCFGFAQKVYFPWCERPPAVSRPSPFARGTIVQPDQREYSPPYKGGEPPEA